MTTIITRLYKDQGTANDVLSALGATRLRKGEAEVISGGDDLEARLEGARVAAPAAAAYGAKLREGNALVVARAPVVPFGTARKVMKIVDSFPAVDAGVEDENAYIREEPLKSDKLSILKDHPLFLTSKRRIPTRTVSESMGVKLISDRKPAGNTVFKGGAYMSTPVSPVPLLWNRERAKSTIRSGPVTGGFMSILKRTPRHLSVIEGGGPVFSKALGLPVLSQR